MQSIRSDAAEAAALYPIGSLAFLPARPVFVSHRLSHRHFIPMPAPLPSAAPERYAVDGGDSPNAALLIPADSRVERHFEIACAATVVLPADSTDGSGWHQMTVLAGGSQQWRRRVATHNPGQFDGLDYRFRCTVPVGQSLRITVQMATSGVRRRSLQIEAEAV